MSEGAVRIILSAPVPVDHLPNFYTPEKKATGALGRHQAPLRVMLCFQSVIA